MRNAYEPGGDFAHKSRDACNLRTGTTRTFIKPILNTRLQRKVEMKI